MKRLIPKILILILLFIFAVQVDAKMYKWRDENGKMHFTDDPTKVPQKHLKPPSTTANGLRNKKDIQDGIDSYKRGDYKTALERWKPLAEQGDAKTQFLVGAMYMDGLGITQDYSEAVKWYRLSAEQEFAMAQHNLGFMYEMGRGVKQDYKEAVKWYRLSAKQGFAKAQYNLGIRYDVGKGVKRDYKEAVKWYKLAAEQGFANAQLSLGDMYYQGQGFPQDYALAHMWFSIAEANGHQLGRNTRDITVKSMTPAQIAEAQKLAWDWMKEHK